MSNTEQRAFTPGPWIWAENYKGLYGAGPNNAVLDWFPYEGMHLIANADANARLIAEAPNLWFQLLAAANYIDALGGDSKSYRAALTRPSHHLLNPEGRPMSTTPSAEALAAILNFKPQLVSPADGPEPSLKEVLRDYYIRNGLPADRVTTLVDAYIAALTRATTS